MDKTRLSREEIEILKRSKKDNVYQRVGEINSQLRKDARDIREAKKTRKRGDNPVDLDKGKTKKMAMPT